MAWIESHQTLGDHPKTKRFMRMLGIGKAQAVGHLHLLWHWCLDYARDGDLSGYDPADIADAAEWDGDPEKFVRALVECGPGDSSGFLDVTDTGYVVHDWDEYGGKLIRKRQRNAERQREWRERNSDVTVTSRVSHRATVQDSTGEESTENKRAVTSPNGKATTVLHPAEFDHFWSAYPRKVNKQGARKAWNACLRRDPPEDGMDRASPDALVLAAQSYARYCEHNGTEPKYIMHPSTFLGPQERWREYLDVSSEPRASPGLCYETWRKRFLDAASGTYTEDELRSIYEREVVGVGAG